MPKIDLKRDDGKDAAMHLESLSWIDATDEPIAMLGRLYPAGLRGLPHSHAKTQLWCARRGAVLVNTAGGRWMIPPGHGLLIPAGLEHFSEMISDVEMHSIYAEKAVIDTDRPKVVEVTALASSLMQELLLANETPPGPRRKRLIMDLLLDEIARLPERPLGLPFPTHARLAVLCRRFLKAPDANAGIDDWARDLGISRRSFTRLFRVQTGVSFVTWRQQACIFASLPRLAEGEQVTNVALDAGYENIAAFTTMFRRMLGHSPSVYLKAQAA